MIEKILFQKSGHTEPTISCSTADKTVRRRPKSKPLRLLSEMGGFGQFSIKI